MYRHKPPQKVNSKCQLCIIEEIPLLTILILEVVDIALIVIYCSYLLRQQFISEIWKEQAFDKGYYGANKGVRIPSSTHYVFSVFAHEEVIERQYHEKRQSCWGKHDVKNELEEVFHVAIADAIINPRTVMVHLMNAESTLTTMMGSLGFPCGFACTFLTVLVFLVFALEWSCHSFFNSSRVWEGCSQMCY